VTGRLGKTFIARYATHILGTSGQALDEHGLDDIAFDGIPRSALHCGFDTARFLLDRESVRAAVVSEFGWPGSVRIVLFAGRIDASVDLAHPRTHKNSAFAVATAIEALRRDKHFRFLFVGPPSSASPVLEKQIREAGFKGQIVLAGIRSDLAKLMIASDVLFFPSRSEGLGMVAVEAQAAGLPVLASTSVPRECVVVPELVHFLDLGAGRDEWIGALRKLVELPRVLAPANAAVETSAFSLDYSARALARLYTTHMP
jgi:glycosyltransferase involved in cell wall biosynthesis